MLLSAMISVFRIGIVTSMDRGASVCPRLVWDSLCVGGRLRRIDRPSLAATLESVAPPGSVEPPEDSDQPGRKVVFEVTETDGEPVLTKQATTEASHTAIYQFSEGKLTDGDYRWRVRVQDGPATSQWTAWCDFSVRLVN